MKTDASPFSVLYKYTKKAFADVMLSKGTFRVGTLHEYRKSEAAEIGDPEEGKKYYNMSDDVRLRAAALDRYIEKNLHAANLKLDRRIIDACDPLNPNPVALAIADICPDTYIFSLTKIFDFSVIEKFGYDACVEVTDPTRFFQALSRSMRRFAWAGILRECEYRNRWAEHDQHTQVGSDLIKDKVFSHQKEVRAIWTPIDCSVYDPEGSLSGQIIAVPAARQFCRRKA